MSVAIMFADCNNLQLSVARFATKLKMPQGTVCLDSTAVPIADPRNTVLHVPQRESHRTMESFVDHWSYLQTKE